MQQLVGVVSTQPAVLQKARDQAQAIVGERPQYQNCCAATLSYLLIDVLNLNLTPVKAALELAYVLQHDFGMQQVAVDVPRLPGDIGVVNQPKTQTSDTEVSRTGGPSDGDVSAPNAPLAQAAPGQGAGYVNPDPAGQNTHHIYLILKPGIDPSEPDVNLIADNQGPIHGRHENGGNYQGYPASKTNYFLRVQP
jgi:hypothetical protein